MISGRYDFTLDGKNRIFIPARLREEFGENIVFVRGIDACVAVYSASCWEAFCARLEELPRTEARHVKRFLYSSAVEAHIDSQGRVILPSLLRDYAKIEKCAIILGVGDHAEIWSDTELADCEARADLPDMEEMLIKLGF